MPWQGTLPLNRNNSELPKIPLFKEGEKKIEIKDSSKPIEDIENKVDDKKIEEKKTVGNIDIPEESKVEEKSENIQEKKRK